MKLFESIKRLHKPSTIDINELKAIEKSGRAWRTRTCFLAGILFVFVVIAIISWAGVNSDYKDLDITIRTEYGKEYTENHVCMIADLQTAIVDNYSGRVARTNIGAVATDTPASPGTVLLVFTDIDGVLLPIDKLNESNRETHGKFSYVLDDYIPASKDTVLRSDVDRISYKEYLKMSSELDKIGSERTLKGAIAVGLSVLLLVVLAAFGLVQNGLNKSFGSSYDARDVVAQNKGAENTKKDKKIERQGIGSEGSTSETEETVYTAEDAIAAEGGFTGTGTNDTTDTDDIQEKPVNLEKSDSE